MIQQVEIHIRVELPRKGRKPVETVLMIPVNGIGVEEIPAFKHWKDERAIAAALRKIAARIERGTSFEVKREPKC